MLELEVKNGSLSKKSNVGYFTVVDGKLIARGFDDLWGHRIRIASIPFHEDGAASLCIMADDEIPEEETIVFDEDTIANMGVYRYLDNKDALDTLFVWAMGMYIQCVGVRIIEPLIMDD